MLSSSNPLLEHHRSPSGTRKVKASADSLHGAEYVECRRSSWCRSCLTNWSIIMYDHETQGLQIVRDAWTNIGRLQGAILYGMIICISWLRQNMPLFSCGWCRNSGTLSIFWMDYVFIPVRLVIVEDMILSKSLSGHLIRPLDARTSIVDQQVRNLHLKNNQKL